MSSRSRLLLLLACTLAIAVPAAAQRIAHPKILIINSYNPEYKWTENQYAGIMNALRNLNREYVVYTEYLDWKRFPDESHIRLMYTVCKEKYPLKKIDLIVTTDDRALSFAIANRKELFSDAPIVFSGVYRESASILTAGERRITGVYEDLDIDGTIRDALRINPEIDAAYVINENTESGAGTERLMFESIKRVVPGIPVYSLSGKTIEEIEGIVPLLDRNSFLLIGSYSIEKNGQTFTTEILANRISKASAVPLFALFTHVFGTGAIGGSMLSGKDQGANAGQLALRFLNGEGFNTLTPLPQTSFVTAFDYNALKRYNISLRSIPPKVTVINREPPFFVRYRTESFFIIAIFFLMLGGMYLLILLNRRNRFIALTDQLTGLPNRIAILKIAERMIRGTEHWNKCGIMFIDIDNFKYINDIYGHETGDMVLVYVANAIYGILDDDMQLARFGGDEFLIVLQNTSFDRIESFARTLHETLERKTVIDGREVFLTISTGISVYPDHGLHFGELYKNADAAMYRAKSAGKTRFVFYNDSMYQEIRRWMDLENGLHSAVKNNELCVVYQPQISMETGFVDGFEALARWNHPKEGAISPGEFIPIAEETGQIVEIGLFVLRTAAQFIRAASHSEHSSFTVSVNVSVKQLHTSDFLTDLLNIVATEGIEPNRLTLEITESILVESVDKIAEILRNLRNAGFGIALDDFGKGYSSLTYLRRLPINYIKMDKLFVKDMFEDDESRLLTVSIISLCHQLSLKVVAEGVETREQVQFLKENACDYIQGFYFSKPVSIDKIDTLLNRRFLGNSTLSDGSIP